MPRPTLLKWNTWFVAFNLGLFCLGSAHSQAPKDDTYAQAGFTEDSIELPKEIPDPKNLKSFTPSAESQVKFALDSKSLRIGKDGVIRYVVVITNSSGTSQVKYEGIRCETFEYKIFANLGQNKEWVVTPNSEWKRIPNLGYNQYQATLGRGGFCTGEKANTNINQILENLR